MDRQQATIGGRHDRRIGALVIVALGWAAVALLAHTVPWLPDTVRKPPITLVLWRGLVSSWEDLALIALALVMAIASIRRARGDRWPRWMFVAFAVTAVVVSLLMVVNAISIRKIGFPFSIQWLNYIRPSDIITFRTAILGMFSVKILIFGALVLLALPIAVAVLIRHGSRTAFRYHRVAALILLAYLIAGFMPYRVLLQEQEMHTASVVRLLAWEATLPHSDLLDIESDVPDQAWSLRPAGDFASAGMPKPNVAVIVMDSVPARYLTDPRYRPLIPNIRRLMEQGTYFENFYTHTPTSTKTLVSLLTGLYPSLSFSLDTYALRGLKLPTVHGEFRRAGYATSFVMSGDLSLHGVRPFLTGGGIEHLVDIQDVRCPDADATRLASFGHWGDDCAALVASDWIDSTGDKRFFQLLWLTDTHHPYFSDRRVTDDGRNPEENKFLNALAGLDAAIGRYLDHLEKTGLAEETIVFLLADHGESFGDHGAFAHGSSIFEEQVHVPLVMRGPGIQAGRRDARVSGIVDIIPTLLDLADIESDAQWQGRSIFSPRRPGWTYLYSAMGDLQIGVTDGREKLLLDLRSGKAHRYDLAKDPAELAPETLRPEEERKLVHTLAAWAQYREQLISDQP